MGHFEPVVCSSGYYCPKGSKDQIDCPAGSYCPPGSETPIKCMVGSRCLAKSVNEANVLPFGLLILVDVLLILLLVVLGFQARRSLSRRGHLSSLPKKLKNTSMLKINKGNNAGYRSLEDEAEMLPLESTIKPLGRSPTGFQAALDAQYKVDNEAKEGLDLDATPELRRFVDSMKKAVQVSTFGLSFGFSQLSFQPKGSSKPILSQISGFIPSGSLTGVMGGSGAGKCSTIAPSFGS